MGWTYQPRARGQTDRAFFGREFPDLRILECATVRGTFYAAAMHVRRPGEIFALVCLTQRQPSSAFNYGYKDMDETMGPCAAAAPAHVLAALTPTENAHANEWRARCRARLAKRSPKIGETIVLDIPMTFGGRAAQRLTKVSIPRYRNVYRTEAGNLVRFTGLKDYGYQFVAA